MPKRVIDVLVLRCEELHLKLILAGRCSYQLAICTGKGSSVILYRPCKPSKGLLRISFNFDLRIYIVSQG